MPSSSTTDLGDTTALPPWNSRPSTRSRESTYSSDSSPGLSSATSKDSAEPVDRGRFKLAFHSRHPSAGRRSASSSVYSSSACELDGPQKENIRPWLRTPPGNDPKKPPVSNKSYFGGGIPLLRRARSNLVKNSAPSYSTRGRKWEELGDEPNSAPPSKAGDDQATSFSNPFGSFPSGSGYGVEVSIIGGAEKAKKPTFAERAAKFGREALPEVRPPWKGTSGRSAFLDPIKNTSKAPSSNMYTIVRDPSSGSRNGYKIRRKSEGTLDDLDETECLSESASTIFGAESSTSVNTIGPLMLPGVVDPPGGGAARPARKPVSREFSERLSTYFPPTEPTETTEQIILAPPFDPHPPESPQSPKTVLNMEGKLAQEPKSHFSWSTYAESVGDAGYDLDTPTQMYPGTDGQDPVSRFSWTTIATDTTNRHTPPSSPSRPKQTSPVMMRRRPLPSHGSVSLSDYQFSHKSSTASTSLSDYQYLRKPSTASVSITDYQALRKPSTASVSAGDYYSPRKPSKASMPVASYQSPHKRAAASVPTTAATPTLHVDTRKPSVQTQSSGSPASSIDKALPLPPTVDKESKHVDALQAKSDDLDHRVSNIQKVIHDLEKLEKASPLEVTEKMRRENRKKLETIRTTLEEVQHERHEVGMALSRARNKAREEEEPSALWLRRVTG